MRKVELNSDSHSSFITHPSSFPSFPSPWQTWLLLLAILLLGAHFRFLNLYGWDGANSRAMQHPDERFIAYTAYGLQVPRSFSEYLRSSCVVNGQVPHHRSTIDLAGRQLTPATYEPSLDSGCNTLNPRNYGWSSMFVYGSLPTTLTRVIVEFYYAGSGQAISPVQIRAVGRTQSMIFDLGSILLVFLIGRRLYAAGAGLLAAFLYACAALPIQLAHFFTVDSATGFFTLLTMYWAVRIARGGGIASFIMLGIAVGCAMACRITMATLGMTAVLAVLQRVWEQRQLEQRPYWRRTGWFYDISVGFVLKMGALLLLSGLMALLTFRLLAPDTFVGTSFFDIRPEPRFIENILQASGYVNGSIDAPFSQQWASRTPFLFPLSNMVIWGMGLPFGIAAWLSWAVAGWQIVRWRVPRHLLPVSWIGFYFAWQGGQFGMTMRYYALLYGLFAVLAGWGLLALKKYVGDVLATKARRHAEQDDLRAAFPYDTDTPAHNEKRILTPDSHRRRFFPWLSPPSPHPLSRVRERGDLSYQDAILPLSRSRERGTGGEGEQLIPTHSTKEPAPQGTPGPTPQTLHPLSWLPLGLVMLGTLLWALAFTSIYQRPHSRLAASQWIYENVPVSATISSELWDDALPAPVQGYAPVAYRSVMLHPYAEDDQVKYTGYVAADGTQVEGFIAQLEQIDYLILASNRVYDSIKRLPMRYPATMRYYHYLFNGELGFELVGDFHSYPTLFGISFPDQGAEEAFSVYDHPRVLIFKKTPNFSPARAEQLLTSDVAFGEVYKTPTVDVKKAATALRLTDLQWALYRAGGTWTALFHEQGLASQLPWLFWLLILELLSLITFLLLFRALGMLADHGFALSKILGLLLVSYAAWLLASLRVLPFEPRTIWACVGVLGIVALLNTWFIRKELISFIGRRWLSLLIAETLFLLSFGAMLGLRALNPDVWLAGGANRLAELATLTAVTKSAAFPPYDPWFAGGYLNIPYFGYVLISVLSQLTGIVPGVAYNLGLATMFALASLGAWGVAYNLGSEVGGAADSTPVETQNVVPHHTTIKQPTPIRAIVAGLIAAACVMLAGPIGGSFMLPYAFGFYVFGVLGGPGLTFPLHMAGLGLLVALLYSNVSKFWRGRWQKIVPPVLLGLVIGALGASSQWDAPPFLAVVALTLLGAVLLRRRQLSLRSALLQLLAIWLLSLLFFLPYSGSYASELGKLTFVLDERSTSLNMLASIGVWLFMLLSAAALIYRRARRLGLWPILIIVIVVVLAIGLMVAFNMTAFIPLGLLLFGGLMMSADLILRLMADSLPEWRVEPGPLTLAVFGWALCGLTLMALSVFLAFRGQSTPTPMLDVTGALAWSLLSLSAGLSLPWVWIEVRRRAGTVGWAWRIPAALLSLTMLSILALSIPEHLASRIQPAAMTLDGTASAMQGRWMVNDRDIALQEDAALIDWMHKNIEGTPIVLEGMQDGNPWSGRVAALTGLPNLIARPALANEQRAVAYAQPVIQYRQDLVSWIYSSSNSEEVLRHLKLYGIEYVYVGELERALYPESGLALFDQFVARGAAQLVYREGNTRLYHIPADNRPPALLTSTLPVVAPSSTANPPAMLNGHVGDLPSVGPPGSLGQGGAASQIMAIAVWLLLGYGLLLLGMPVATLCFAHGPAARHWNDAGYAWARLIGLLILGYAVWLPVSAGQWYYDWRGAILGLGMVVLLDMLILAGIGYRRLSGKGSLGEWLSVGLHSMTSSLAQAAGRILQVELIFLLSFGFMLFLRALNPDLWQPYWGGEKPFEFGLLNAILRSPVMPPYSPFFSDGTINYYYYGIFLVSLPIKLAGIAPSVGFNLVIATLYALFCSGLFALAARISGHSWVGLAAVILVALFGNLAAFFPAGWSNGIAPVLVALRDNPADFGAALGSWFVGPSRVVPNTINEFPFWGFLFADLHPHLIAMPITLLVIGLVYNLGVWGLGSGVWEEKTRDQGPGGVDQEIRGQGSGGGDQETRGQAQACVETHHLVSPHDQIHETRGEDWGEGEVRGDAEAFTVTPGTTVPVGEAFTPSQSRVSAAVRPKQRTQTTLNMPSSMSTASALLLSLCLGTLAVTNSWDLPTYALLLAGVLLVVGWRRQSTWLQRGLTMLGGALLALGLTLLGLLLFTPFFSHFQSPVGGLGLVTTPTKLRDYLLIYGIFLAILLPGIMAASWRVLGQGSGVRGQGAGDEGWREGGLVGWGAEAGKQTLDNRHETRDQQTQDQQNLLTSTSPHLHTSTAPHLHSSPPFVRGLLLCLGFVLIMGIMLALAAPILARGVVATSGIAEGIQALFGPRLWALVLILCALPVLLSRRVRLPVWFATWLAVIGLAVSVGIELVYIRDHLKDGDWYRMNTVFKFGVQIWVLLGLAAALMLPGLLRWLSRRSLLLSVPYGMLLIILAGLGLVYPIVGIPSRVAYRFPETPGMSLDGLAFLDQAVYYIFPAYLGLPEDAFAPIPIALKYDAEAIHWLNENIAGTPVVLQSSAEFYRLYGVRMAANTGLPTIVSPLHEAEQRDPQQVWTRDEDVQQIYRTSDPDEALRLMAQYQVAYIVVGPIERIVYGEPGTQKFEAMSVQGAGLLPSLQVAYQNEQVTIYSVDPAAYQHLANSTHTDSSSQPGTGQNYAEIVALEQQHKADPDNTDLIWKLAQAYADAGRPEDAIKLLEPLLTQKPDDVLLLHVYGDLQAELGNHAEAEAAYRRAVAAEPTAGNLVKLANGLISFGKIDEAEELLAQATSSDPNLASAQCALGAIAEKRARIDQARSFYQRCLELARPGEAASQEAAQGLERLK